MQRKKIIRFTMILLLGVGLGFGPYHAEQKYTSQYVVNDNRSQVSACGTDVANTTEITDTESDYIADDIVVPALGADISKVQALENTDVPVNPSADQLGQGNLAVGSQTNVSETPPSQYDFREYGYVTEPKSQGVDNTCWVYSVVGAAETDMVAQKRKQLDGTVSTTGNTDFSEDHLAYFFYHTPQDPMGNTNGDATNPLPPGSDYRSVGGNHVFTTFALADWYGLADESETKDMAVSDWANDAPQLSDYSDSVHMQKAYWINLAKDTSNVKKMIQQYGSVAISMYYSPYFYNSSTNSYYNSVYSRVNHAVQVIGWDDNYDKSKFSTAPSANGAWLAKFSYGNTFGNAGYVWISYEDAALNDDLAKAFVFDFERADNYDHIYQYDGSAGAYTDTVTKDSGYRVTSGNSIANVFTVPMDNETGYQKLSAVSFALYTPSVDYSVQIYKDPVDPSNPESGTPLLTSPKTGTTTFVGYYTIPLDEQPILSNGDTFSVVVTLSKSSKEDISYFVDKSYTNGNWINFTNAVSVGQSFAIQNGGWQDLANSGVTARVKAFTDNYQVSAEALKLSVDKKTLWKGDQAQLKLQIMPSNASFQTADWSSSDNAVVTVDKNGALTAKEAGTAVVTATAKDNSGLSASCTVTVQQPVERIENVNSTGNIVCMVNQTVAMQLKLYPANTNLNSVYFRSLNPAVATVDASGQITGYGAGTTTIQVYSAYNKKLLLSCDVNVQAQMQEQEQATDNKLINNSVNEAQMVEFDSLQNTAQSVTAPKTGDESGAGIWLILMTAGIFVTVMEGRKLFRR